MGATPEFLPPARLTDTQTCGYVHDFGHFAPRYIYLETELPSHLVARRMLRTKWLLTPTKIQDAEQRTQLRAGADA